LKSSADSSTTSLQNEKDELAKERDRLKEELKSAKDKLNKEKEEISSKNEELSSNLKKVTKMREELEEIMKTQEHTHNRTITVLRKHLLRHVRDMQVWKGYLESDREYEVEPVKIISDTDCEKLEYGEQIKEMGIVLNGENKRLEKLIKEREIEAAEVVSVNIGKKKKRIKKDDPLIDKIDFNKVKKPTSAPRSTRAALGSARSKKPTKK